jgi:hypothetical protein
VRGPSWSYALPRRPGDEQPDPPGGRAAERRRAFLKGRFPRGEAPATPPEAEAEPAAEDEPAEPPSGPTDEEHR